MGHWHVVDSSYVLAFFVLCVVLETFETFLSYAFHSAGLAMMVFDTFLYAFLGAYLQAVLPTTEFGVPRYAVCRIE